MLNVSEIASSTEERVLTGVKVSQALVIDGLKNTVAFADRVIPAQISDRVEDRVSVLPAAAPMINGAFDFAGKLLAAQRDFAGEIVEIFQPAPKKAAPKKPAAKKAAPRKAAAKKTTKKAA
jgi:hypothetical protein